MSFILFGGSPTTESWERLKLSIKQELFVLIEIRKKQKSLQN